MSRRRFWRRQLPGSTAPQCAMDVRAPITADRCEQSREQDRARGYPEWRGRVRSNALRLPVRKLLLLVGMHPWLLLFLFLVAKHVLGLNSGKFAHGRHNIENGAGEHDKDRHRDHRKAERRHPPQLLGVLLRATV